MACHPTPPLHPLPAPPPRQNPQVCGRSGPAPRAGRSPAQPTLSLPAATPSGVVPAAPSPRRPDEGPKGRSRRPEGWSVPTRSHGSEGLEGRGAPGVGGWWRRRRSLQVGGARVQGMLGARRHGLGLPALPAPSTTVGCCVDEGATPWGGWQRALRSIRSRRSPRSRAAHPEPLPPLHSTPCNSDREGRGAGWNGWSRGGCALAPDSTPCGPAATVGECKEPKDSYWSWCSVLALAPHSRHALPLFVHAGRKPLLALRPC